MARASVGRWIRQGLVGGVVLLAAVASVRAAVVPAELVFHVDSVVAEAPPVQLDRGIRPGDTFFGTLGVDAAVFESPETALGAPAAVSDVDVRIGDAVFDRSAAPGEPDRWIFDFAGNSPHVKRLWGAAAHDADIYRLEIAGTRFSATAFVLVPYDAWARCDVVPDPHCGAGRQALWGQSVAGRVKLRFAGEETSIARVAAPSTIVLTAAALFALATGESVRRPTGARTA